MRAVLSYLAMTATALVLSGCEIEPFPSEKERIAANAAAEAAKKADKTAEKLSTDPISRATGDRLGRFPSIQRARIEAERGNFEAATKDLETALKENPESTEALRMMTRLCQELATRAKRPQGSPFYLRSADSARRFQKTVTSLGQEERKNFPTVFYNEACTLAVNGESDRAIQALNESVALGFSRLSLLDTDPELDSLRNRPDFKELVHKIEAKSVDTGLAAKPPFSFDFTLKDSKGQNVKLADSKGKVVLVEFWGAGHIPSRKEIPHLIELDKRYRDKGLQIVGINDEGVEGDAAKSAVASFVEENKIPFPCLIGDEASRKRVVDFKGFPTTLFVGRDGQVRLKFDGYQTLSTLDLAAAKLLDEQAKPVPK